MSVPAVNVCAVWCYALVTCCALFLCQQRSQGSLSEEREARAYARLVVPMCVFCACGVVLSFPEPCSRACPPTEVVQEAREET